MSQHHSLGRMAAGAADNTTTDFPFDPLLEDNENRYWGLSDRDVPILIGAAAGEPESEPVASTAKAFSKGVACFDAIKKSP